MYEKRNKNILFLVAFVILVGAEEYNIIGHPSHSLNTQSAHLTHNLRHKRSQDTSSDSSDNGNITVSETPKPNVTEIRSDLNNKHKPVESNPETKPGNGTDTMHGSGEEDISTDTPINSKYSYTSANMSTNASITGIDSSDDISKPGITSDKDTVPYNLCGVAGPCKVDNHTYYNAAYIKDNSLWLELTPGSPGSLNGTQHLNLSSSMSNYGYSHQIEIPNFLFYGLPIKNITVLTGGFLHVGAIKYLKYLTQVQYIAPFMGHFNPSISNDSNIYYFSNDSLYIFQWDNMRIENKTELGNFTFQVQLHANNDIVFAYKEIPTTDIPDDNHATNIGISDAYSLVTASSVMINVYHKIGLNKSHITNNTAIRLSHQPLCTMISDCYSCTTETLSDFECHWCDKLNKCSDRGIDSGLNEWIDSGCLITSTKKGQLCNGYCYYPDSGNNTTYTPAKNPDKPIIEQSNSSSVKVDCDPGYSVSVNYNLSVGDVYTCTSGGVKIPQCFKSCNYTVKPVHGEVKGLTINSSVRPDSKFNISCDPKHRLRDNSSKHISCIDNGTLEPDPQNIRCEKFCTLPHLSVGHYYPVPTDTGFLHEGESTTLTCKRYYMIQSQSAAHSVTRRHAHGPVLSNKLNVTCEDDTDLSSLEYMCVGYCMIQKQKNTTYSPELPLLNDVIRITCDNGTKLEDTRTFTCSSPGIMIIPGCVGEPLPHKESRSSHSFIILLVIFIGAFLSVIGGWVFYAYRNPTSPSGLFLIDKCRPWTWRSTAYRRHEESLGESYYMEGGI